MGEPYLGSRFLLAAKRATSIAELRRVAYDLVKIAMPAPPWDSCSLDTLIAAMRTISKPGKQMHEHAIVFEERAYVLRGGTHPAPTPAGRTPA